MYLCILFSDFYVDLVYVDLIYMDPICLGPPHPLFFFAHNPKMAYGLQSKIDRTLFLHTYDHKHILTK